MQMPVLETERLIIRPFVLDDLDAVHHLLDDDLGARQTLEARRQWLQWSVLNYEQLAHLYQPPYGDRAIVLRGSGQLIGSCGLVPALILGTLPYFRSLSDKVDANRAFPEFGLYYGLFREQRGQGYATEAAQALIDYAFGQLNLIRIIATTTDDNQASMKVMRRLGMQIERNPHPEPAWFQVVGILENQTA